jgi:hypothetical protein
MKKSSALRKVAFIPDCHWPYVDKKAWGVCLRAIRRFQPDETIVLGDFGDFYCTSRHTKDPNRTRDLKVEVDGANGGLDELDATLKAVGCESKKFCKGNHEYNLERYLAERAPELFNLVSVDALFMLKARGYKVVEYKDFAHAGKLLYTHDVGFAGRDGHIRSAADTGTNTVIGHTHRLAVQYGSNIRGRHHVAAMLGWLGDKRMAEYLYKSKKTTGWHLGFGVGYQEPNGTVHVSPIPIIDYRCVIEGALIT